MQKTPLLLGPLWLDLIGSLGESYPSVEMQSVYSAALVDWSTFNCI